MCVLDAQVECKPFEVESSRFFLSPSPTVSMAWERTGGPCEEGDPQWLHFLVRLPHPCCQCQLAHLEHGHSSSPSQGWRHWVLSTGKTTAYYPSVYKRRPLPLGQWIRPFSDLHLNSTGIRASDTAEESYLPWSLFFLESHWKVRVTFTWGNNFSFLPSKY